MKLELLFVPDSKRHLFQARRIHATSFYPVYLRSTGKLEIFLHPRPFKAFVSSTTKFLSLFWRLPCVLLVPPDRVLVIIHISTWGRSYTFLCDSEIQFSSDRVSRGSVCVAALNYRCLYRLDPINSGLKSKGISEFYVTEIYLSKKVALKMSFSFFARHGDSIVQHRVMQIPSARLHGRPLSQMCSV